MLITAKNLINLPVTTESGENIGRLVDFTFETDSQSILSYTVKPSKLIEGLLKGNLEINRGQVIDITKDKIIVEDNLADKKFVQSANLRNIKQKQAAGVVNKDQ